MKNSLFFFFNFCNANSSGRAFLINGLCNSVARFQFEEFEFHCDVRIRTTLEDACVVARGCLRNVQLTQWPVEV